jgi:hypothetical protein
MIDFLFGIGRKVSNIQSKKVREIRDQKKLFDFNNKKVRWGSRQSRPIEIEIENVLCVETNF